MIIQCLLIIMSSINENLIKISHDLKKKGIPHVVGGAFAILMLCKKYGIECPFGINNVDIFYMKNTPIPYKFIHNACRKVDSLRTTNTYVTPDKIEINLTMVRSHRMAFIPYEIMGYTIYIMHPCHLISYYNDDFERTEMHDYKLFILNYILDIINTDARMIIEKNYHIYIENNIVENDPQESRPKNSLNKRLQTITE